MTPLDSVYKKNQDIVFRQIGDECILVPIRQNSADLSSIYTLNPVAAFIWQLFDGKNSLSDILSRLTAFYDVAQEIAQEDLFAFVDVLLKADGVELVRG